MTPEPASLTPLVAEQTLRERLDSRYRGPLMSFFGRRLRDREQARDLTQEAFFRIIRASGSQAIEHSDAFVFQVAANLLRDHARRQARGSDGVALPCSAASIDELLQAVAEERTPERELLGCDTLAHVLRSLDELGERTRDIFVLFRLENMKQRDIANLYGISVSTVEKHVMRATLHLALRHSRP
jgi:RNA polymerase sigma-70 factor (ECF subfamily)